MHYVPCTRDVSIFYRRRSRVAGYLDRRGSRQEWGETGCCFSIQKGQRSLVRRDVRRGIRPARSGSPDGGWQGQLLRYNDKLL